LILGKMTFYFTYTLENLKKFEEIFAGYLKRWSPKVAIPPMAAINNGFDERQFICTIFSGSSFSMRHRFDNDFKKAL
jgi:hypothetical protein